MSPVNLLLLASSASVLALTLPPHSFGTITSLAAQQQDVSLVAWLPVLAAGWFFLDKLIDVTPLHENTLVQLIRNTINKYTSQAK
jgi:hypothetical protein